MGEIWQEDAKISVKISTQKVVLKYFEINFKLHPKQRVNHRSGIHDV
jgi:hypothetical protein